MTQNDSQSIWVTGAAGFIGYRWAEHFHKQGFSIVGIDEAKFFENRPEHSPSVFARTISIQDLFSTLEQEKPKPAAILHLGACSDTTQLDEDFLRKVNTEYTQKIWNYCTDVKIPLVYASSAATYGAGENGYSDDESKIDQLKPLNPYGWSKQNFDLWALEQSKKNQTPPSWYGLKFFNVFGFGERHKNKMASVAMHAFDQIQSRGFVKLFRSHHPDYRDGEQKRDFISVDDSIEVVQFLLDKNPENGIYNLGTGKARSFLDLTRSVFRGLEKEPKIEFIDTPVEIRDRYQYFTEASMTKLEKAGYTKGFSTLEDAVGRYVKKLLASSH